MRFRTPLLVTAAIALAACGADDDTDGAQTAPDQQSAPEAQDDERPDGEQPDGDPSQPDGQDLELPDPDEMVSDGVFRGEGIVLPAPEGWAFDEMALSQGIVSAATEDGLEQLAGQALDTDEVPDEELTVETLIDANRAQIPGDPTVDESVEIDGAEEAHQLRYDDVDPQIEGQPTSSILMIVADDGNGRVAVFNYAAASDDYDDGNADLLLETAGFDPDSDPTPPAPMPVPEGEAPSELDEEELPELDDAPEGDDQPGTEGDTEQPEQD